jgi:hypothetical protein
MLATGHFRRSRMQREMDAEFRFHLDAYSEDLVRSGVPRQEALRRARIEFGGINIGGMLIPLLPSCAACSALVCCFVRCLR